MEDFDDYSVNMDTECLHQDFDDIDLYGNKIIEDSNEEYGNDLILD